MRRPAPPACAPPAKFGFLRTRTVRHIAKSETPIVTSTQRKMKRCRTIRGPGPFWLKLSNGTTSISSKIAIEKGFHHGDPSVMPIFLRDADLYDDSDTYVMAAILPASATAVTDPPHDLGPTDRISAGTTLPRHARPIHTWGQVHPIHLPSWCAQEDTRGLGQNTANKSDST